MSTVAMMAATKVASGPVVKDTTAVAAVYGGSPYVQAWPLNSTTGFGTRYANPSPLPSGYSDGVAFSPSQAAVVAAVLLGSPFNGCYHWSESGFGAKYNDPASPLVSSTQVAFNSTGDRIAFALNSSPYLCVYEWNDVTGFGNKFADPNVSGMPVASPLVIVFAPDNKSISIGFSASPWIFTWAWDNILGFGTRYSNPSVLPDGSTQYMCYSPASDALIMSMNSYPDYIGGYHWNSVTGYGSRYAPPSVPFSPANPPPLKFSPDGATIALPSAASTMNAIRFNSVSGFGARYAGKSAGGNIVSIDWTRDGKSIIAGTDSSPYICGYPFDVNTGLGTKFTDPGLPGMSGLIAIATN